MSNRNTMNTENQELDPEYLDEEEKLLVEAFHRGEFEVVDNIAERKRQLQQAAKATLKRRAINIRLPERDLRKIKLMAQQDGIPYQTLIASIVHRYSEGTLRRHDE